AAVAIAPRLSQLDAAQFAFFSAHLGEETAPLERLAAARVLATVPLQADQLLALAQGLSRVGPLAAPLLLKAFAGSKEDQVGQALVEALTGSEVVASLPPDELAGVFRNFSPHVQSAARPLLQRIGVDLAAQQARLA